MWTGPVFKILADKAGSIYPGPLLVGAISEKSIVFLLTSQDIIRDHVKIIFFSTDIDLKFGLWRYRNFLRN